MSMVFTTTGRTSGLPRRAVLGAIVIDGHLYAMNPGYGHPRPGDLDHPFGERAHWYKNLLADPIVTVQRGGRTWTARATRLTDRDEAVTLYEGLSGATRTALRVLLHAQGSPTRPRPSPRTSSGSASFASMRSISRVRRR